MTGEVVDLGIVRIWIDGDGIIHLTYAPHAVITVEVVKKVADVMRELSCGKKRPVFVDARGLKNIDREARIYSLSAESVTEWISAMATLSAPVVRVLGDFFIKINRPPYPIKYFSAEDEALKWLRGFLDSSASRPAS